MEHSTSLGALSPEGFSGLVLSLIPELGVGGGQQGVRVFVAVLVRWVEVGGGGGGVGACVLKF